MEAMARQEAAAEPRSRSLADLGVDERVAMDALATGRSHAAAYSGMNTVGSAGTAAQSWTVRSISKAIASGRMRGWARTKPDPQNQAMFIHDDQPRLQFIVFSGDPSTGTTGDGKPEPSARCPRGRRTKELIDVNRALLGAGDDGGLFPDVLDAQLPPASERLVTWVLLFHIMTDGRIRAEMSLPIEYRLHGDAIDITRWAERIILPPIEAEGEMPSAIPEAPGTDQYDFAVSRKGR